MYTHTHTLIHTNVLAGNTNDTTDVVAVTARSYWSRPLCSTLTCSIFTTAAPTDVCSPEDRCPHLTHMSSYVN